MNNESKLSSQIDLSGDLFLLPLRNAIVFPGSVVTFEIGRAKTVAMAEEVAKLEAPVLVAFCQKDPAVEDPGQDDLYPVGTRVRVAGIVKQPTGRYAIVVEGVERVELREITSSAPFTRAKVERLVEDNAADDELDALGMSLRDTMRDVVKLLPGLPRG